MANIDYKAAYQELVNSIRKEMELWRRESEHFRNESFKDFCADDLDAKLADDSLAERYKGMADECQHILETADCIVERRTNEQDQHVKQPAVPTDDNGRVSLHLVNLCTGACVYDLDCHSSDVPTRVWLEMLITEDGNTVQVSTQQDHIHQMRMYEWYGYKLTAVWNIVFPYVWRDDSGKSADYGPHVWMAQYRVPALATC